nr:glucose PTS transporter subunit EIIB [Companilactobacillus halodurans]
MIFYFALYYFVFRFAIQKFNLKTPGREDDDEEATLHTKQEYVDDKKSDNAVSTGSNNSDDAISATIVEGLGGKTNISTLEACATRLRVSVKDPSSVKKNLLKSTGAVGTVIHGTGVQVIYGTKVSTIGPEVEDYLGIEDE